MSLPMIWVHPHTGLLIGESGQAHCYQLLECICGACSRAHEVLSASITRKLWSQELEDVEH